MSHSFLIASVLLVLNAFVHAQDDGHAPGRPWPFGVGGPGSNSEGLDLYNLGLLGAKVSDADKPPPTGERKSGRQEFRGGDDPTADKGPARLRIEILFPDGPAMKAGLTAGDVIVGMPGKSFDKGSLEPLAAGIHKAASAEQGVVALEIERVGAKKSAVIRVPVPSLGKEVSKLWDGKGRDKLLRGALDFLLKHQQEDGGFPSTLCGLNGAVVQTSLAGLAWLTLTPDPSTGPYAETIEKASKFVLKNFDAVDSFQGRTNGSNWDQSNWGYVHAAIFIGELHARKASPLLLRELQRMADTIVQRQEASGGYAHGPGGKNALDYLELNIVTGLALSALGVAAKNGVKVDKAAVEKAMKYLELSGGGDGGVGYSTSAGQKGSGNIGRTAAGWLGLRNLGQGKSPFATKMRNYIERNTGNAFGGHASLMQHILLAGVAAEACGGEALKRFREELEDDLVLALSPDGSFQPRPWHETVKMKSNSDVSFGQIWTTAAWSILLGADPKELPGAGLPCWLAK